MLKSSSLPHLIAFLAGVAAVLSARAAAPTPASGLYFGANVSVSSVNSSELTVPATTTAPSRKIDAALKNGDGGALTFGYAMGPIRWEAELGQLRLNSTKYEWHNDVYTRMDHDRSELNRTHLLASGYYDFPLNPRWDLYVGAGAGPVRLTGHTTLVRDDNPTGSATRFEYKTSWAYAYQGVVGFTLHISPVWAMTFDLRETGTSTASFDGYKLKTGATTSLVVGFRYRL